jgi:branched-chain amino acid transport system permease protein
MLNLAFAQLLYVLALKLRNITGGEDGISIYPRPDISFLGLISVEMTDHLFFYIAITIITLALCCLWFLTKTPFGQIMVGMRDNAKRIEYLGFRVPHSKAIAYIISGAFAGLSGSIYLLLQTLISTTDAYSMPISVFPIMMVMLGGVMNFFGPIYGAALFAILEEWIGTYTGQFELVLGILLVVVTMYWPLGLAGYINTLRFKWHSWKHRRSLEGSAS